MTFGGPEAGGYHPERDLNGVPSPEQLAAQQHIVQEGYGDTVSEAERTVLNLTLEEERELARFLREELL